MALGPSNPTWKALYDALAALAVACDGTFAFVLDEGNGLWCVGIRDRAPTTMTFKEDDAADRFYRDEIVPRTSMMQHGRKFEIVRRFTDVNESGDRYFAVSFASIYALVVWFDTAFDVERARTEVRKALPRIESLVVDLPPSGGPSDDEAAAKVRAYRCAGL
ncbi:MAG TPA: hypothetical protein VGH28_01730 [Polyangiaceae bacterium]